MAKETPSSEKRKNDQNGSAGRQMCTRSLANSGSATQETSGLRRSVRETSSKNPSASASSIRKSERLEKQASTSPPVSRKSERIDEKNVPSPSGMSDRGKNVSPSNSRGSKMSSRNSATSSDIDQRNDRKEKSVEELINGTKQHKARMTRRAYRALIRRQPKKSEALANQQENKNSDTNPVADIGSSYNSAKDLGETVELVALEDSVERAVPCSAFWLQENGRVEEANASANAGELAVPFNSSTVCVGSIDTEKVGGERPRVENSELPELVVGESSIEKVADPSLKRKQSIVEVALDAPVAVSNIDGCIMSVEGTISSPSRCKIWDDSETCSTCLKRQRVDHESVKAGNCSCSAKPEKESDCMASQDRGITEASVGIGFEENNDQNAQEGASLDSKSDSLRFAEYWVPVHLSNIQLEQYCLTLLFKSLYLSTMLKNDAVGVLYGILVSLRKTCDHPYVVDPSLQSPLTKNLEKVQYLDVDIKASGKLQLLDAMLTEIRKRGSKAVVLYQRLGGFGFGGPLIGDFLDDFVRERFGPSSYERVECEVVSTKKQNALSKFNKESGRFVLLLETRACNLTIKLSSVDTFILFDSSWNPSNDLRALQKIKVESESERTKIFRLYSTCTVEEKVLVLARQNKTVDSPENLNPSTKHALLMWGATHLFDKLNQFHSDPTGGISEQSVMAGAVHEFLSILSSKGGDKDKDKLSLILEAKHFQGTYSTDSPLFGEEKVKLSYENNPIIFWRKLLEGKKPKWKYCSVSSQRNRKRSQYYMACEKDPEVENGVPRKRKKAVDDSSDLPARHDEEKVCRKRHEGALEPPSLSAMRPSPRSVSSVSAVTDTSTGNGSPGLCSLGGNVSEIPDDMLVGNDRRRRLDESQKGLHTDLKQDMAKLYRVLHLSEEVKSTVEELLEYVINNHRVCKEPTTALQAFQIAMCWTAASLRKQKIKYKESLALAKEHLTFSCSREEVEYIYSMLCCMKSVFLEHMQCLKLDCLSKDPEQSNNITSGAEILYDSVKKDIAKAVREVQKKCSKQVTKLLEKHKEDKKQIAQNYAKESRELETKKNVEAAVIRVHISSHSRPEKLKKLDIEYGLKFDELRGTMEKSLENLERMHTSNWKTLTEKEAHWIERIQSWAKEELLNVFLDKDSNSKHCGGVNSSNTSKNVPHEAGACNGPTGDVIGADTNDMVSEDGQGGLLAMDSLPKVQNTEGTTLDGGTQFDVTELEGSTYGQEEDVHPVTFSELHLHDLATENRPDKLPPVTEREISTAANCQGKVIALTSEDQVCSGATSPMPDGGISSTVPNTPQPGVDLENAASIGEQASATMNSRAINVVSGSTAVLEQQNEEICSIDQRSPTVQPADEIESGGSAVPYQAVRIACPPSPSPMDQLTSGDASRDPDLPADGECTHSVRNRGVSQDAETSVRCTEEHVEHACEALVQPSGSVTGDQPTNLVSEFAATLEQQSEEMGSRNWESPVGESVLSSVQPASADQASQNTCPLSSSAVNIETQNISEAAEPQVAESIPHLESGQFNHGGEIADSDARTEQWARGDAYHGHDPPMDSECTNLLRSEGVRQNAGTSGHFTANHEAVVQLANTQDGRSMLSTLADTSLPSSSLSQSAVQATPQIPFPFDPFQYELERIRREVEKREMIHNEETSQLKAECERKIAEIVAQVRREYDGKLREAETKFHAEKKEFETNTFYIVMNKYLADAFRTKCTDSSASAAAAKPRDANSCLMQQPLQLRPQRRPTIPPLPSVTSTAPPPPTPSAVSPLPRFSGPPSNSSLYPMPQARPPPLIANTAPSSSGTTLPSHGRVRAPAPHLQPFRPSSLPRGTLTQPSLQNPPTTISSPPTLAQHVQRPLLPAHQNALYSRVQRTTIEGSSTIPNLPVASAISSILIQKQLQRQQQQQQGNAGNQAGVGGSPDVVCLSDDE